MPAQSGSSAMLKAMGRGYTREAYIELIEHVRQILPGEARVLLYSFYRVNLCQ